MLQNEERHIWAHAERASLVSQARRQSERLGNRTMYLGSKQLNLPPHHPIWFLQPYRWRNWWAEIHPQAILCLSLVWMSSRNSQWMLLNIRCHTKPFTSVEEFQRMNRWTKSNKLLWIESSDCDFQEPSAIGQASALALYISLLPTQFIKLLNMLNLFPASLNDSSGWTRWTPGTFMDERRSVWSWADPKAWWLHPEAQGAARTTQSHQRTVAKDWQIASDCQCMLGPSWFSNFLNDMLS